MRSRHLISFTSVMTKLLGLLFITQAIVNTVPGVGALLPTLEYSDNGQGTDSNPYIVFTETPADATIRRGALPHTFTCRFRFRNETLARASYTIGPSICIWLSGDSHVIAYGDFTSMTKVTVSMDVEDPGTDEHYCRIQTDVAGSYGCRIRLITTGNYGTYNAHDTSSAVDGLSIGAANEASNGPRNVTINSRVARLNVLSEPGAPIIDLPLNAKSWIEGDKINITCSSAYGTPAPKITLYFNNRVVVNGQYNQITEQAPKTLNGSSSITVLHTVTLADDGATLSCSVLNKAIDTPLKVDHVTALDVKFAPRVYTYPMTETFSIPENDKLRISCFAIAKPRAYNLRWYLSDDGNITKAKILTEGSGLLTVEQITSEHMAIIVKNIATLFRPNGFFDAHDKESFLKKLTAISKFLEIESFVVSRSHHGRVLTCVANNSLVSSMVLQQDSNQNNNPLIHYAQQPILYQNVKINVLYEPIVTSVPEIFINEGQNLTLTCNVDSNPPPTLIRWVKKEREVSIDFLSTTRKLIIPVIKRHQSATYQCSAQNKFVITNGPTAIKFGRYETKVYVLYPPGRPRIRIQRATPYQSDKQQIQLTESRGLVEEFERFTIEEGEPIELYCDISNVNETGNPAPQFSWGKSIFQNPADILNPQISSYFTSNNGHPNTPNGGGHQSFPPDLSKSLREIGLAGGPVYKIGAVKVQDTGIYYCLASNTRGKSDRARIALYVKAPPKYVPKTTGSQIADTHFIVNESQPHFALECSFTARPEARVIWFKNGKQIAPFTEENDRSGQEHLPSREEEYRYKLSHISTLGSIHSHHPSERATQGSFYNSLPGTNAQQLYYKFYLNSTSSPIPVQYVIKHTSYLNWKLSLTPQDRGIYTCLGLNTWFDLHGNSPKNLVSTHFYDYLNTKKIALIANSYDSVPANHKNFTLRINHPPVMVETFTPLRVVTDENTSSKKLRCVVFSDPEPEFNWRFQNHMLPKDLPDELDAKYRIVVNEIKAPGVANDLFKLYESVLTINKLAESDYDQYTCIVNNELGFSERGINLTTKSVPDRPIQLLATSITSHSANISCRPGLDGGYPQTINVYYQRINNATNDLLQPTSNEASRTIRRDGVNRYLNIKDLFSGTYQMLTDSQYATLRQRFDIPPDGIGEDDHHTMFARKLALPVPLTTDPDHFNVARMLETYPTYPLQDHYGETDVYAWAQDVNFNVEGLKSNSKYVFWAESQNAAGFSLAMDHRILITTGFKEYSRTSDIPVPATATYISFNDTLAIETSITDGLCLTFIDHNQKYDSLFECIGLPHDNEALADMESVGYSSINNYGSNHLKQTTPKYALQFILSELKAYQTTITNQNSIGPDPENENYNGIGDNNDENNPANNNAAVGNATFSLGPNGERFESDGLYIKFCAIYDPTFCGEHIKAHIIGNAKPLVSKGVMPKVSVVMITVSLFVVVILVLVTTFILVCMRRNKEKILKDYEMKHATSNNGSSSGKPSINGSSHSYQHQNGNAGGGYDYNNNNVVNVQGKMYGNGSLNKAIPTGGFINRGMDLVDEKGSTYGNGIDSHGTASMMYDPYNTSALGSHQNYHQKTNSIPAPTGPASQNGTLGRGTTLVAPTRFRTPEDLLLAASLEDDDDDDSDTAEEQNPVGMSNNHEYYEDFGAVIGQSGNKLAPSNTLNGGNNLPNPYQQSQYPPLNNPNNTSNNNISTIYNSDGYNNHNGYKQPTNLQNIHNPNFNGGPSPSPLHSLRHNQFDDSNIHSTNISETSSQRIMHEVIV